MNPRSAISNAAHQATEAQRKLLEAVADAYGTVPVTEIAELAQTSRPTVYAMLREAGVQLRKVEKV